MDRIKKLKVKKQDGTFSDYIPIGADAENIDTTDGESVQLKLNKKPYYYDNVAAMKADSTLKAGDMAITLGYYEANDGGGAEYIIKALSDLSLIDNMFFIEIINSLTAELLYKNVDIQQIGAKNIVGFDNSSILNAAIQKIDEKTTIEINNGEYEIYNTIIINKQINIKGNGTLVSKGCTPLILITASESSIDLYQLRENESQELDVLTDKYNINAAIVIKDCKRNNIKIERVQNFQVGCLLYSTTDTHYNNIQIHRFDTCFYGYEILSHDGGSANANLFSDTSFAFHNWPTDEVPYFIKINSFGPTFYNNNCNIFRGMKAEYGVIREGGPRLVYCDYAYSHIFEIDRVEIASTSNETPFVFGDQAKDNHVYLNFMSSNFIYNNMSTTNKVFIISGPYSNNLTNMGKYIQDSVTFPTGGSIYGGYIYVDYYNRICYVNVTFRSSSSYPAGTNLIEGLPTPKRHIRYYTKYSTGNDWNALPTEEVVLSMNQSISPSNIKCETSVQSSCSIPINLTYKF